MQQRHRGPRHLHSGAAAAFDDDPHVGSLDAIHLACAKEIGAALSSFVTYDKTLARAAAAAGLPLEQPT